MNTQSLELTRSAKLYRAIKDYCTNYQLYNNNKSVRRYIHTNCLSWSSTIKLLDATFSNYDLNTLPINEIKQVIFDAVNIISDEVNSSDMSDRVKSTIHKGLLYVTAELFSKLWNLETDKSRSYELRKLLLTFRSCYTDINKHLDIIQRYEYKNSQNSSNSIGFDDFIDKMKVLKNIHSWNSPELMNSISFDDLGMYNLGYYGWDYYRPNIIGSYLNESLEIRGRVNLFFTQDTNLTSCGNCGLLEIPTKLKSLINDRNKEIYACEDCMLNSESVLDDYTKSWLKVYKSNKNLYNIKIKSRNTTVKYLPSKEKLDNYILRYGLLDNDRNLTQVSIDYNELESLLFREIEGYHIQYEFLVLMSEIISEFDLSTYIELDNIKQRYIETMQELKIKYLYVRRDEYYYYLPENRQIESIQDLESKGMKSKKWTNFFKKFLNTDNSVLLEKVSRYAKTRITSIQDLVSNIKITSNIYDIYSRPGKHSCMSNKKYVKFYESIGDVEVAYMEDPEGRDFIIGRALIWHNVEAEDLDNAKVSFMDRIYSIGDQGDDITGAFKQFARNNGYYWKKHQTYTDKMDFIDPDTKEVIKLSMYKYCDNDLDFYDANKYPYMDTMTYGYSNVLTNKEDCNCIHDFSDLRGGGLHCESVCEICGERCSEDDITYNEEYGRQVCYTCLDNSESFFYCDHCDTWHYNMTQYELTDESHWGETVCDRGLSNWNYILDHRGDPVYMDNAININDEWYRLKEIEGEYFMCEGTEMYYFFNDVEYIETESGIYSENARQFEKIKEQLERDKQELENNVQLELEGVRV